ncbi:MAG: hypothetical protein K5889_00320 [Lachnospiraceae bacterium]|jgi:hypothetical protein|nr:hypothetical protein [Lachnospiraceae bacterium]
MDWLGLFINVAACFAGVIIYCLIMKTPWGKRHEQFSYLIVIVSLLIACLLGGGLRALLS